MITVRGKPVEQASQRSQSPSQSKPKQHRVVMVKKKKDPLIEREKMRINMQYLQRQMRQKAVEIYNKTEKVR